MYVRTVHVVVFVFDDHYHSIGLQRKDMQLEIIPTSQYFHTLFSY